MGRIVQWGVVIWTLLALLAWGGIFLLQGAITFPQIGYYVVLLLGVGLPLWFRRARIQTWLQRWRIAPLPRFLLLGYGMVLIEEVIAATLNHLLEGFDLLTYPLRIGQFWALNVFAFTGFIWGWYLLRCWFAYSPREAFLLSGCFGLIAEHTIALLPLNPIVFLLLAPLNILTYGLILSPGMLSLPEQPTRHIFIGVRYGGAFVVPLVASILPILLLTVLRSHFPLWFPPCKFVAC